jgi:hypothetical protein
MAFKLQLREDRPATIEEHRTLRAEIERLRKALEWYAALANWNREADAGNFWRRSLVMDDEGKRARDALAHEQTAGGKDEGR